MKIKNILFGLLFTLALFLPLVSADPVTVDLHFFNAAGDLSSSSSMNININTQFSFGVLADNQFYDAHVDYPLDIVLLNSQNQRIHTFVNFNDLGPRYNRIFNYQISQPGTYYIVADTDGASDHSCQNNEGSCDVLTLTVRAPVQPPVNHAPTFVLTPYDYVQENGQFIYDGIVGEDFNLVFTGHDADGDAVHFTLQNVQNYVSVNGIFNNGQTATLDWTAPTVNEYAVKVTAIDEYGLASTPKVIVLKIPNHSPILRVTPLPDYNDVHSWTYLINLGETLDLTVRAEDLDQQLVHLSIEYPSGMISLQNADYTYGENTLHIRWTPTELGTNFGVRVKGNDGYVIVSKIIKVRVSPVVFPFFGCTDETALNHDENAVIDDGSCIYEFQKLGCTDPIAENYDETAFIDDGTCFYEVELPDLPVIRGCTNPKAENYNLYATLDDGSCRPLPPLADFGCTDENAENYDPEADIDDGSCTYPPSPRNVAPVIESVSDQRVQETHTLSFTVSAEDSDGPQRLRYEFRPYRVSGQLTLPPANSWVTSFDAQTGEFVFTPSYEYVQHPLRELPFGLEFRAFDGEKYSAWEQVKITVLDLNRNPEITQINVPAAARVNELVTFSGDAVDDDGDVRTYTWTIDGASRLGATATHTFDEKGVYTITLTVRDNYGGSDFESKVIKLNSALPVLILGCTDPAYLEYKPTATLDDGSCATLIIEGCTDSRYEEFNPLANVGDGSCHTLIEVNHAPVMDSIKEFTIKEKGILAFKVNANDAENDKLTYEVKAYRLVAWFIPVELEDVTFNPQSGEFSFSPDYDFVKHPKLSGLAYANFRAFDGEEYSEWMNTKITVLDVNRDPVIKSVDAPELVLVGEEADFSAVAKDADGDTLTYTWAFNKISKTGTNVKHVFTQPGTYAVTLNVADNYGGKDTWTGSVKVKVMIVEVPGCTNPIYVEYNPDVTVDDGSCQNLKDYGCTNPDYVEYDPAANTDDGSCKNLKVFGCTNQEADNYNPNANVDDGNCKVPVRKERDLYIAYAHPLSEVIGAGETETFNIKVVNPTRKDIEDLRLSVVLYDLNLKQSTSVFDLDSDDDTSKVVNLQLPEDAPAGDYLVKITISNDYLHESVYRQIVIS